MKKLMVFAVLMAIFTPVAFTQTATGLTIRGGMDMVFIPLQIVTQDSKDDNVWVGAGLGRNTVNAGFRTRFDVRGSFEDKLGVRADVWFLYSNRMLNFAQAAPAGGTLPTAATPPTYNTNQMEVRLGDYGVMWWRPLSWLRFDLGRFYDAQLSGKVSDHSYVPYTIGLNDAGSIFSYYYAASGSFLASLTPIENLFIGVYLHNIGIGFDNNTLGGKNWVTGTQTITSGGNSLNNPEDNTTNTTRALRMFQRTWISLGYQIPDIGHARFQFAGATPAGTNHLATSVDNPHNLTVTGFGAPRFEAAFAYTGVNRLTVDFGAKVWIPVSDWISDDWNDDDKKYERAKDTGTYWGGLHFALGVIYSGLLDNNLTLRFRADTDLGRSWEGKNAIGNDVKIVNPVRLNFHFWPSYNLGWATVTFNAGLEYVGRNTVEIDGTNPNDGSTAWDNSDRLRFGTGLWIEKFIASSSLRAGLTYSTGTDKDHGDEKARFTIPIILSFHF